MAFEKLSQEEKEIVLSCFCAVAKGPFIQDDGRFRTRLGVHRSTLDHLVNRWPEIDDSVDGSDETLAINNAMNEVCYGIRFSNEDWRAWFNVDRDVIRAVYKRWSQLRGKLRMGVA